LTFYKSIKVPGSKFGAWGFALRASTPQAAFGFDPTSRVWGFALRASTPQAGFKG